MSKPSQATSLLAEIATFNVMVASAPKFCKKGGSEFVKKAEEIPKIEICAPQARSRAL